MTKFELNSTKRLRELGLDGAQKKDAKAGATRDSLKGLIAPMAAWIAARPPHCWRVAFLGWVVAAFGAVVLGRPAHGAADANLQSAVQTLVQADAADSDPTRLQQAYRVLREAPLSEVPSIFKGMGESKGPLADNWLRASVDAIAERELRAKSAIDGAIWEAVVQDRSYDGRARRVAYEWLREADPQAPDRLLPNMLDDPSPDLRFDAVQRLIDEAGAAPTGAMELYQRALDAARDAEQVQTCATALEKLGHPVDLVRRMGFVPHWRLIGPFDNAELKGFAMAYPPEIKLDLSAELPGKAQAIAWKPFSTDDKLGKVDLNQAIGEEKDAVAYAAAVVESQQNQQVAVRLACKNAPKVWCNGKLLGACEAYHTGIDLDQFVYPVELMAGKNVILVKACQNAKEQPWEKDWGFQLRVTDPSGGPAQVTIEKP